MITVNDLSVQLNGQLILHQVSLKARPGEVTVLLGPNGSGKTTLLLSLSAQITPQEGRIVLADQPLAELKTRALARVLAIVPQEHHPVFPYTVREVMLLGRLSRVGFWSQPGARDREVVTEIIELLGIKHLAGKPYTRISGGERQLALLGRCLAQEPLVLLLDEPTNHLDFRNQVMILQLIRELAHQRGLTVLLTLHDPNLALIFADHVILLASGRIVAHGKPAAVISPETMADLYGLEVGMLCQGEQRLLYPKLP
ncbi:MAG: ABC transporter ATP-binding protein [Syntrophobacterales bacterium]|jgi:iron complex transport system ATP-binding protein|nr:ABC transporter ATP-binding protein [Syntrophobacterales bacterium]